ncbi:hypothetical protein Pan216_08410 [Planctomycetes bacterium Pan216]|uniref:DUF1320 domain-containing protein n=1 Tax=Kolteria novifilia TaxID=2527975 RepID=A0A518AZ44_9BACT|nr:hypothetical protein Pan216_08410 [Planctomycetes bacterium Pan216]
MSYCTSDDLVKRLGDAGILYVADDDADNVASSDEREAAIDEAIRAAGAEIDGSLLPHVNLPIAGTNDWLRQRAIDLASEHLAERRGSHPPASLTNAAQRSRGWLEEVRLGTRRVPGLSYPSDRFDRETRHSSLPRVGNPTLPRERAR